jgi:hypothetical protein
MWPSSCCRLHILWLVCCCTAACRSAPRQWSRVRGGIIQPGCRIRTWPPLHSLAGAALGYCVPPGSEVQRPGTDAVYAGPWLAPGMLLVLHVQPRPALWHVLLAKAQGHQAAERSGTIATRPCTITTESARFKAFVSVSCCQCARVKASGVPAPQKEQHANAARHRQNKLLLCYNCIAMYALVWQQRSSKKVGRSRNLASRHSLVPASC